ncbi:MAG: hypothetical protein AAF502_12385 [Bacteroidota bacterium]
MKTSIGLFLTFCLLTSAIVGCTTSDALQEAQEKISELNDEISELEEDKNLIRAEYNEVIDVLNEIDETLMEIDAREKQMENLIGDLSGNELQRELILGRIEVLKEQNIEAQKKANEMQGNINNIKSDNKTLNRIIKQYEQKLKQKDEEIAAYEVRVNQIEAQLQFTEDELATQYAIVQRQRDSLATAATDLKTSLDEITEKESFIAECTKAWYVAGTKKTLRQADILKKGGLNLTADYSKNMLRDYPFNFYTKTEIETDRNINVILPERPEGTYEISGNKLLIKDVETFWQTREVVIVLN